jgi:hypothetical protein
MNDNGWQKNLNDEEYHRNSGGVSSSGLKTFLNKTGAHFAYQKENPKDDTDALALGKLLHALVLEPDTVTADFVEKPKFTGTGAKAKREAWQSENENKCIVSADNWLLAQNMRDAIFKNSDAAALLGDVIAESSIFWDDFVTGEKCKVRPDALPRNNLPFCVDLKSTLDASASGFAKSVHNFNYHLSAAMYLDGISQTPEIAQELGYEITDFVFVVVEKDPPHLTAVYRLDDEALGIGLTKYRHALRLYAESRAAGFPGYPNGIRDLTLPAWAFKNEDV